MSALLASLAAYLLGGIPTGVLVSRQLLGRDVRDFGSHNSGAVNVWRTFGLTWGLFVVVFDIGKGFFAASILPTFVTSGNWEGYPAFLGLVAVVGHIWSPFTGFRGGKGVGTVAGAALALHPVAALWAISAWCLVAILTKYSSVASLTAGGLFPTLVWWIDGIGIKELAVLLIIPIVLFWTHRENLLRLREGRELKIGRSQPVAN